MSIARTMLMVLVTLLIAGRVTAQVTAPPDAGGKSPKAPKGATFKGDVAGLASDRRSFSITDKSGAVIVIPLSPGTSYQLDGNPATAETVLIPGLPVKGDFAPDGSAAAVAAKTPKPSALDQMQVVLIASDEEWQLLRPLVEQVQAAQAQLATLDKPASVKNLTPAATTVDGIRRELAARREARAKVVADLNVARKQLTGLLTVRQEFILVQLGILE